MTKRSWVQHPITGKMIPKDEYVRPDTRTAYIQGDIESFVSPIDGRHITDRSHLRRHNRDHGVTNSADYSKEFMLERSDERIKRMSGQTKEDIANRKEIIARQFEGK